MDKSVPYQTSPLTIVYKIIAGFLGGAVGSGAMLLVFTAAGSVLKPVIDQPTDNIAPIIMMAFLVMVFVSSMAANIVSNVLMALTERSKYKRLATTIFQTFLLNLVVFIFTAPIYFIVNNIDLQMIAVIAGLQIILSVIASSIILEMISNSRYGLIGLYSAVLGTILAVVVNVVLYQITDNQFVTMLGVLPVLWGVIGLVNALLNIIYFQLYKLYGVDFLSSNQGFGGDNNSCDNDESDGNDFGNSGDQNGYDNGQGGNQEGNGEQSDNNVDAEENANDSEDDSPITDEEVYEATTKDEKGADFLKKK